MRRIKISYFTHIYIYAEANVRNGSRTIRPRRPERTKIDKLDDHSVYLEFEQTTPFYFIHL